MTQFRARLLRAAGSGAALESCTPRPDLDALLDALSVHGHHGAGDARYQQLCFQPKYEIADVGAYLTTGSHTIPLPRISPAA